MNIDDVLWNDDKKAVLTDAMEVIDKVECLFLLWREDDGSIHMRGSAWKSEIVGLCEIAKHTVLNDTYREFNEDRENEQDG